MKKITEQPSLYDRLEAKDIHEILTEINQEDRKIANVVANCIPEIEALVEVIEAKLKAGGRLFYIGAGTSGRLGVLDASECPPTFGVSPDLVIGLIAGGDRALRKAAEHAEDSTELAWEDLQLYKISSEDVLIGIAASGTTPYVVHGLRQARRHGIVTGCITCNPDTPLAEAADYPIVAIVGPEYVTGSTRMKAGTAQKLILNMISTTTMIRLGHIQGSRMVDMQLTNDKLIDRGTKMIMEDTGLPYAEAEQLLKKHGSVRNAITHFYQSH
ncbi:MAG: N-acetylmuramic acid 6-phosphate etherase [Chitinophagales bacterium]|nr:N-acetylmuramic acid 6-phosphate etherase [Chitinophagales bacterium]